MTRPEWTTRALVAAAAVLAAGCHAGDEITPSSYVAASPPGFAVTRTAADGQTADRSLRPAAHFQPVDEQPPLPPEMSAQAPPVDGLRMENLPLPPAEYELAPLDLPQVVRSVIDAYPLLQVVAQERMIRDGKVESSWGEFDLQLKAFGIAAPEGFYQNYRHGLSLTQPIFRGGYAYGGYKIGRGNFQPWFKERDTNDGGEFALGLGTPLLQGRAIDKRRAALFQAEIDRQVADPMVETSVLEFVRIASISYWVWVASGQALDARQQLQTLAERRVEQIDQRVEAGDLPLIARINNNQLVASRETRVIEAQRKLEFAAIDLSLFLRDAAGNPIVPSADLLPPAFPQHQVPSPEQIESDIALALATRPEMLELDLMMERVAVELAQAENMLLPKLDAQILASKDVGQPASSRDKTPFELEAGLYGEVPLQRREARGKIRSAQGKLGQLRAKRQFQANKITAEVQKAVAALVAEAGRIDRAETNLRLAVQTLDLAREQFDAQDIDVLALNLYEEAVMDAQLILIAARADYFAALASYHAALALDPLRPTAPRL